MKKTNDLKLKLQKIALMHAKNILYASGFRDTDTYYSLRQYEMQFAIYNQLKLMHGINE